MKFPMVNKIRAMVKILRNLSMVFDDESNTLMIKNNIPLNIAVDGKLRLIVDNDFEIQTSGQMDILSHGSLLCLDSLNSKIYLNSRRTKYCQSMKDRFSTVNRTIAHDETDKCRNQYDRLSYEALFETVQDLNERLSNLEET